MVDQHIKVTVTSGYDTLLEVKNDAFGALVLHKYHSKFEEEKKEDSAIILLNEKIVDITSSRDYYSRVYTENATKVETLQKTVDALKAEKERIKAELSAIAKTP